MSKQQSGPQAVASKTGSADAAEGSVAVSGTVVGDINLFTGVPVRTRYREQVLRIAPPDLIGRDIELAALADFCTVPDLQQPYVWWRGGAWAGKSALMSWFVLNPPQKIRVVSFFITSRLASQDDRVAFIENVLEQLATLLDEPIPAYLTESTRDAHLLGMLSDAAHACKVRGERLILIVDGLDEDRGVTIDAHAYSIAALLPDPPPADMRIVVAGRPNPPIPTDVPEHHILRDPAIVRRLAPSPFAAVVRNDMEGELKRLLLGTQTEQDLLGLLTAARGGLSGSDLAELTASPAWQVDDELRTVTGRSFRTRPSRWLPGIRPDVYILGHEELQGTAKKYLGNAKLRAYQERLHAWASCYRERGWPAETPEYLLRGYYQMLKEADDLERMIACATDRHRQDRMLEISGGDNAAIEEITTAQDVIVRSPEPDLIAMARLAIFRDYLADRNTMVPVELPAAWASVGQAKRGEALARSIIQPGRREVSLVELVKAVTAAGDFRRAEIIAQSITRSGQRSEATMVLLRAKAMAGDIVSATALLPSIPSRGEQTLGWAILAQASAEAGHVDQAQVFIANAEAGLSSAANPRRRGEALATMAQAEAAIGHATRVRSLIGEAEALAKSIQKRGWQAAVLAALVKAVAAVDGQDQARQVIDEVETLTQSITDVASRARAVVSLARVAAVVGDVVRARALISETEDLIRSIEHPGRRAAVWATLLRTVAAVEVERARRLAVEAEATARSIVRKEARATGFAVLARALSTAGEVEWARRLADEAEVLTRTVVDSERGARNLGALVKSLVTAGALDQAEEIAQSIPKRSRHRVEALISVGKAVAAAGELDHAKAIARSLANPAQQSGALAALAKNAASVGNLGEAEEITRSITSSGPKGEALTGLANAVAVTGDLDRAETITREIKSLRQRSSALATLAEIAASAGKSSRAVTFAEQAEVLARSITGPDHRATVLVTVAKAVATTGNLSWARRIARSLAPSQQGVARAAIVKTIAATGNTTKAESAALAITDRYWRAISQIAIVEALAVAGKTDHAYRFAEKIRTQANHLSNRGHRDSVLVSLAKVVATIGHLDQAESVVQTIASPGRQAEALIVLSDIADPARAPVLIARAVQLHQWTTSLAALVQARPAALEVIVREVLSTTHPD